MKWRHPHQMKSRSGRPVCDRCRAKKPRLGHDAPFEPTARQIELATARIRKTWNAADELARIAGDCDKPRWWEPQEIHVPAEVAAMFNQKRPRDPVM